ncbi:MAG: BamA/TamA family outer membrane protein [Paludibacteraceae bacterium]|nr:BamA/TamA family outer membrane protein [Paludibacteraceae bacterium]MBR4713695.1 BamA/TamA family outer membrane protein [Paludibacteraceae bacterium]
MERHIHKLSLMIGMAVVLLLSSCSTTKYVPKDNYLLDKVSFEGTNGTVNNNDLTKHLRQKPNFKAFGLFRIYLGVYNLSGRDSTKRINRKLRNIGEAPVVYDPFMTYRSEKELQAFMKSKGYMNAEVSSSVKFKKKKAEVTYNIVPNAPYRIRKVESEIPSDRVLDSILHMRGGLQSTKLKQGMLFDVDELDEERERLSRFLRRRGYYRFNKDFLTYTADSSVGNRQVDVTLHLKPFSRVLPNGEREETNHDRYRVRHIYVTEHSRSETPSEVVVWDTLRHSDNMTVLVKEKPFLRPSVVEDELRVETDTLYNEFLVERTYSRLNGLGILRSSNIRFTDLQNERHEVDCEIDLYPAKPQSFSLDVEGTNSDGDLGFALNLGYAHKNVFRGSEVLSVRGRYAQEAYSGLSDILQKYVLDLGGSVGITFPRFMFPFLRRDFKRRISASTEYNVRYNYQVRPNTYERKSIATSMKYLWTLRRFYKYTLDLIDLNYVDIETSKSFDSIYSANRYSVLRESYSDHFVMNSGFAISYDNQSQVTRSNKTYYRISFESAGALLNGICHLVSSKDSSGQYTIGRIPFSQYVKAEADYSYNIKLDGRSRLVYHVGLGIACPYGNASVVPFERRFFGGGANGVRGWSVRTLGPGRYTSDSYNDFVKQSGDVKLLLNLEYRTKLIWKAEAAAFVDAGNIWTLKNSPSQPKGQFNFKKLYEQIALAYGLGIRLDFSYFLIRFDVGVKAFNPAREGRERWRFHGLNWSDDCALHFAVGYPF